MRPDESFVGQSVRSLQTMLRTLAENGSAVPSVVPDGIYGRQTMSAVSAFQRENGIPVTGVVNQQTWDQIVEAYRPARINVGRAASIPISIERKQVFGMGDRNANIALMQAMLKAFADTYPNIPSPPQSGELDEKTAHCLEEFQRICALPCSGKLDKMTWHMLAAQFCHVNACTRKHR